MGSTFLASAAWVMLMLVFAVAAWAMWDDDERGWAAVCALAVVVAAAGLVQEVAA